MSTKTRELVHSSAGPLHAQFRGEQPLDESKIGDSLLFITEDNSTVTMVVSAYSNTVYYTIVTEGTKTFVYRGSGKASLVNWSTHVATVSAALRGQISNSWGRFWNWSGEVSDTTHPPKETKEKDSGGQGNWESSFEKESGKDVGRGNHLKDGDAKEHLEVKLSDTDVHSHRSPRGLSTTPMRVNEQLGMTDDEMFFIHWGKAAASSIGRCTVKIDKASVAITYEEKLYSLRVGEDGQRALFLVGRPNGQVVWTKPRQVDAMNKKVQTIFSASIAFYPEVRPFLDAIIVAFVIWERKKGILVQI